MHRGKQADAAQAELAERARSRPLDVAGRVGLNMKNPTNRDGCRRDRRGDRLLVAGNARDDRGACDAVPIELGDPAIRQLLGAAGIVPSQAMRYCDGPIGVGQIGKPRGQQLEKPLEKKWQ